MPRPKQYNRDEALERAMHMFWIKGFSATSIKDLVQEMGINRFSIYEEFGSKENLYIESFGKYRSLVTNVRMKALENDSRGIECLDEFFVNYINDIKKNIKKGSSPLSCLSVLNAVESVGREPDAAGTMNGILRKMITTFEKVLERASDRGEINRVLNIHESALLLVGCTYGLDVMSKFLGIKDMSQYKNSILQALK